MISRKEEKCPWKDDYQRNPIGVNGIKLTAFLMCTKLGRIFEIRLHRTLGNSPLYSSFDAQLMNSCWYFDIPQRRATTCLKRGNQRNDPFISCVSKLDKVCTFSVILEMIYLKQFCKKHTTQPTRARWIFSLLKKILEFQRINNLINACDVQH